ncbi:MAG: SDR family NAD(P)-dependent oxidoreductase [Planctomycetaceae bacterium]
MRDLKDKWSLVTGASSGIGAEFARQLAARGSKLVLVARREERLQTLSDELSTESRVVAIDLLEDDAIEKLHLATTDIDIALLVNNAGFGDYGPFTDIEPDRAVNMVQLNIQKLVELTHAFLPHMIENKHGAIINLASTSAFQAVPFMSLYAATKAFVLHFSEGLWAETRKKGVTVQALCPGFTKTEFFDQANLPSSVAFGTKSVEDVVSSSLNALAKGRQYNIPGWVNYVVSMSNRFVTRRLGAVNGAKMFNPKRHKQ